MKTLPNFIYKTIDLKYQAHCFQFHLHTNNVVHFGHFDCFDENQSPIDGMSKVPYLALAKIYPNLSFHGVHQTHSSNILFNPRSISKLNTYPDSDALTSIQRNQALYIKTADCIPLILFDDHFISILHLGHKGFFDGLTQKFFSTITIKNISNLKAYIGPSIQKCCFEVSSDFIQDKLNRSLINQSHIITRGTQYYLSLISLLLDILLDFGMLQENIIFNPICTKCNDGWFSHRENHTKNRISHLVFKM